MTQPYLESGRAAEKLLQTQPAVHAHEQRLLASLRGFKQVINLLGAFGIVLIPVIGVLARSAPIAAVVALNFLGVIILLEMMERRVKHALHAHREKQAPAEAEEGPAEASF